MALDKRQKILIGVASAVVVGTVIFIIVNRKKKEKKMKEIIDIINGSVIDPSNPNAGQKIISEKEKAALPDGVYPIKFGEKIKSLRFADGAK